MNNIEEVTYSQREIMNRVGKRSPINHTTPDLVVERIADWAVTFNYEIIEVETHKSFILVAFTDGSVHIFGYKGRHIGLAA